MDAAVVAVEAVDAADEDGDEEAIVDMYTVAPPPDLGKTTRQSIRT